VDFFLYFYTKQAIMKRIIIVRHAKSVPYGYDDDFNRDLTDRGLQDAEKISARLKETGVLPDLVIASPAVRTMHTAGIFCQNLGYDGTAIQQVPEFYEGATTQDFIEVFQQLPEDVKTVFVFGHNPSVYYLVYNLVKYFNADMPTCSTVAIDFPAETWDEVGARGGKLAFHYTPKSM
jgi:phosphohistidine phosphatase